MEFTLLLTLIGLERLILMRDGEAVQGTSVSVAQGNINSNTTFKVSTVNPIVIGSTSIAFTSSINLISNDVIEYNGQNLAFAQTSLDNWWFAKAGNFTTSGLDNIAIGPFCRTKSHIWYP